MRAALVALALTGCVTGNTVIKVAHPTIPVFAITVVADLLLAGVVTSQIDSFTGGAVIGSTLAITAVDVGIGCLLGGCAALRP